MGLRASAAEHSSAKTDSKKAILIPFSYVPRLQTFRRDLRDGCETGF
jgi:hypothetical protein